MVPLVLLIPAAGLGFFAREIVSAVAHARADRRTTLPSVPFTPSAPRQSGAAPIPQHPDIWNRVMALSPAAQAVADEAAALGAAIDTYIADQVASAEAAKDAQAAEDIAGLKAAIDELKAKVEPAPASVADLAPAPAATATETTEEQPTPVATAGNPYEQASA